MKLVTGRRGSRAPLRSSACLPLLLACCLRCVYRIPIQQGNFLEAKDLDQVNVGMTRSQVRYLLGTPMVADSFNEARWDYIYYLKHGRIGEPTAASVHRVTSMATKSRRRWSAPVNSQTPRKRKEIRARDGRGSRDSAAGASAAACGECLWDR